MDTQIIVAGLAGIPAIAAAVFAYRSSSSATKVAAKGVDAEVFTKAQALYDGMIRAAEREIGRLQASNEKLALQVDQITTDLNEEQAMTDQMRRQLRVLQAQVSEQEEVIAGLRGQIEMLGSQVKHMSTPAGQAGD